MMVHSLLPGRRAHLSIDRPAPGGFVINMQSVANRLTKAKMVNGIV